MTRFQFLRWMRRLIESHMPGVRYTRMFRQEGGYSKFYVDLEDGSWFEVTIKRLF